MLLLFIFLIIIYVASSICISRHFLTNSLLNLKKKNNENQKYIEIVVSRYKEDLKWTLEHPFNKYKYIVYNKGEDDNFEKANVDAVYYLKNEGKCDHANLYHIYRNYDNLKDITIFIPACIDEHYFKYEKTKLMMYLIEKYNNAFCICDITVNDLKKDMYHFRMNNYRSATKVNINNSIEFVQSDIRPFGAWYEKNVNVPEKYISFFAIFSVDKRDIYNNTKYFYYNLMKEIEGGVVGEKCFYIELSLMALFSPMKHTYKIDFSNYLYNSLFKFICKTFEINPIFQMPHICFNNLFYFLNKYTIQ